MRLIGRIICFFKGHRRGKFIRQTGGLQLQVGGLNPVDPATGTFYPAMRLYQCPRCGRETHYKVKQQ